jgi:hypothetical protein
MYYTLFMSYPLSKFFIINPDLIVRQEDKIIPGMSHNSPFRVFRLIELCSHLTRVLW